MEIKKSVAPEIGILDHHRTARSVDSDHAERFSGRTILPMRFGPKGEAASFMHQLQENPQRKDCHREKKGKSGRFQVKSKKWEIRPENGKRKESVQNPVLPNFQTSHFF